VYTRRLLAYQIKILANSTAVESLDPGTRPAARVLAAAAQTCAGPAPAWTCHTRSCPWDAYINQIRI